MITCMKNLIYTSVMVITLNLLGFSFFAFQLVSAQTITGTPSGGDSDIVITAHVVGCGDNIVQTGLGEQCDGVDLNGTTCSSLGFGSGILSCRTSCIFETNLCGSSSGGSSTGPGSVVNVGDIFTDNTPYTNIVFTGYGEPGSIFFVMTDDGYFTSVYVDNDGYFSVTVSEPYSGNYDFVFYTISSSGLFGPRSFSTTIPPNMTTYINNIFIPFNVLEEELSEELELTPLVPEEETNLPLEFFEGNTHDIFREFLDILAQNENLTPEELRDFIEIFAEQKGYEATVPGYQQHWWRSTQTWLSQNTNGLSEWYPNVYISFMVPYWNIVYDVTEWFDEYKAPFWVYKFFL